MFKIGFTTAGSGGNPSGIGKYVNTLDSSGLPATVFCFGGTVGVSDALELINQGSSVHHVLGYRPLKQGIDLEVPLYNLDPFSSATEFFTRLEPRIADEVRKNKSRFWIFLGNELDKNRAEWLGEWGYGSALLWNDHGYNVALYNFSSGEPEPEHWRGPQMKRFLGLCAERPDTVAVGLHEYSFTTSHLLTPDRSRVGRFLALFAACKEMGIGLPSVLISEMGWTHEDIPTDDNEALAQLEEVALLYAQHPSVKGAGLWWLGPEFDNIAYQVQPLIAPITAMAVSFVSPNPDPLPVPSCIDTPIGTRTHLLLPQQATRAQKDMAEKAMFEGIYLEDRAEVVKIGYAGWSHLDAIKSILEAVRDGNEKSRLVILDGHKIGSGLTRAWLEENCSALVPYTVFIYSDGQFKYEVWPTEFGSVSQHWGDNRLNYKQFGLPGHDGLDLQAPNGSRIFAVSPGRVYRVEKDPTVHNYGIHVRIEHDDGEKTIYAHLDEVATSVGAVVAPGQVIGYADNTGNSYGSHLHFGRKISGTYSDRFGPWPHNLADPTPLISHLAPYLFTSLPQPKPEIGTTGFGLHASADPGVLSEAEFQEFRATRPDLIKVLSAHAGESIARLAGENQTAKFIIRAFLVFGGRTITPQQFVTDTLSDVKRALAALGSRPRWIELHNEPNLVSEGWGTSWSSARDFGAWLESVLKLYKQELPNEKFLYPGLSPGPSVLGVRSDMWPWLNNSFFAAGACDGIGIHAYWNTLAGSPDTIDKALAVVDGVVKIVGATVNYPAFVTEASNNQGDTPERMAEQYIFFWNQLKYRQVFGVTYYVASASNPEFAHETWIDKGIGIMVTSR